MGKHMAEFCAGAAAAKRRDLYEFDAAGLHLEASSNVVPFKR